VAPTAGIEPTGHDHEPADPELEPGTLNSSNSMTRQEIAANGNNINFYIIILFYENVLHVH